MLFSAWNRLCLRCRWLASDVLLIASVPALATAAPFLAPLGVTSLLLGQENRGVKEKLREDKIRFTKKLKEYSKKKYPDSHKNVVWARNSLARTCLALGEAKQAYSLYRQIQQTHAKTLSKTDPVYLRATINVARAREASGKAKDACKIYESVLKALSKVKSADDSILLRTKALLAAAHHRLGEFKESYEQYRELHALYVARHSETHLDAVWTAVNCGAAALELGDYREGRRLLEKAAAAIEEGHPQQKALLRNVHHNLACVYQDLKDWKKARSLQERVLRQCTETRLPETDEFYLQARVNLGTTCLALGDLERADDLAKDVIRIATEDHSRLRSQLRQARDLRKRVKKARKPKKR